MALVLMPMKRTDRPAGLFVGKSWLKAADDALLFFAFGL
jgi:hypothetical protein